MKYHVNNRKSKRRPCGLQCLKWMTVDLNVLNLFLLLLLVGWLHFFSFFFKCLPNFENSVHCAGSSAPKAPSERMKTVASPAKRKGQNIQQSSLTWTEKYRPKTPNEIVGNQQLVCVFF